MEQKRSNIYDSNMALYFVIVLLFAAASCFLNLALGVVEFVIILLLFFYFRRTAQRRRRRIQDYMENVADGIDTVEKASVLTAPVAMLVFRPDTMELLWSNERFREQLTVRESLFGVRVSDIVPTFSARWLLEGKTECPDTVEVNDRLFRVYGSLSRPTGTKRGVLLATTYWVDITEIDALHSKIEKEHPVVGVIMIDNYEELTKAGTEASRSAVLAQIDEKLAEWVAGTNSILCRYDRNRYLFVTTAEQYAKLAKTRFSVLDAVRGIVAGDGVAATLSIGIGKEADTFEALFSHATLSIDMALSRGGDQVVVRNKNDFEFYGGKNKASEKRTKVKSRVMANALGELISDASQIYIMGHKNADMDAIGAAAGICAIARKRGKKANIVIDSDGGDAGQIIGKLKALPEYEDVFISGTDAFIQSQASALLVVVDTNRPDLVESEQLLDACNRVAVIDHHRRAANYIESAALNYHEPYASSASELVAELVQYLTEPNDLLRAEAEALLAGIILDTKNFTMRTGSRTFEAAAMLRRAGAETVNVHEMFRSTLPETIERYDIIRHAEIVFDNIVIAAIREQIDRVSAAKAADELLTLSGIRASFVLFEHDGGVIISARSSDKINVQLIMEQLGGGGNAATAGGQVEESTVDAVREQLLDVIAEYLKTE